MKRFVLALLTLASLAQLTGCGSGSSTPANSAGLSGDAEHYQKQLERSREKDTAKAK